jgi:hypothetical protein
MSLVISSVANAGEVDRERVVMKASADIDIGKYALFCCKRSGETSVNDGAIPAAYWFADKTVKAGDFVVLYTKSGKRSEKSNNSGGNSYFFYWGKSAPIWTDDKRAVLLKVSIFEFGD